MNICSSSEKSLNNFVSALKEQFRVREKVSLSNVLEVLTKMQSNLRENAFVFAKFVEPTIF